MTRLSSKRVDDLELGKEFTKDPDWKGWLFCTGFTCNNLVPE